MTAKARVRVIPNVEFYGCSFAVNSDKEGEGRDPGSSWLAGTEVAQSREKAKNVHVSYA